MRRASYFISVLLLFGTTRLGAMTADQGQASISPSAVCMGSDACALGLVGPDNKTLIPDLVLPSDCREATPPSDEELAAAEENMTKRCAEEQDKIGIFCLLGKCEEVCLDKRKAKEVPRWLKPREFQEIIECVIDPEDNVIIQDGKGYVTSPCEIIDEVGEKYGAEAKKELEKFYLAVAKEMRPEDFEDNTDDEPLENEPIEEQPTNDMQNQDEAPLEEPQNDQQEQEQEQEQEQKNNEISEDEEQPEEEPTEEETLEEDPLEEKSNDEYLEEQDFDKMQPECGQFIVVMPSSSSDPLKRYCEEGLIWSEEFEQCVPQSGNPTFIPTKKTKFQNSKNEESIECAEGLTWDEHESNCVEIDNAAFYQTLYKSEYGASSMAESEGEDLGSTSDTEAHSKFENNRPASPYENEAEDDEYTPIISGGDYNSSSLILLNKLKRSRP